MNADEKRAWNVWQAWCLSAAILLGGCAIRPTPPSHPPAPATDAAHGDRAILDWVGTYAGIVPCADCPGVREVITLNKHLSYEIATQYVGRDDQVFRRGGGFSWVNGHTIRLEGMYGGPALYHVGKDALTQLGRDGKPITGPLAARFILKKIGPAGTGEGEIAKPLGKRG